MSALATYLKQLNSADSQWGVWVNPKNPTEEYRIGQYCFENGGMNDGWIHIGSLANLSNHSDYEAFEEAAAQAMGEHKYNKDALYEAFLREELADELQDRILANIDGIHEKEAYFFIEEKLPAILEEVYA